MGKRFDYEYVVIGGGTAGIVAASQLVEAGRKVALVEQEKWGGRGYNAEIPEKALLNFSHLYADAVAGSRMGLSSANLRYNYPTVQHFGDKIAGKATFSRKDLEEKGITCIKGKAHFVGSYDVAIEGQGQVSAGKFLIATGASLNDEGITGLDQIEYLTAKTAMKVAKPPKAVLIVGGGASGCETAQYLAELGAKVVIVEMAGRLLPTMDEEVGQVMEQYLTKRLGIKIFTNTRVIALEKDKVSKRVVFIRGGQEKTVRVETIVLATGSKANTDLGLKNAGVSFDKNGIIVDKTLQTTARNIWAAGDVIGGPSSTERAEYTAEVAVINLLGRGKTFVNYCGFMEVVNTNPQVVSIGLTEEMLKKKSRKYRKTIVPLSATNASITNDYKIGFLKILADSQGKVLGASMIGPHAADVMQELSLAIRHGLPLIQIASTPHASNEWNNIVKVAARKLLTTTR
ncbi:NAD(P)/FAD-dependent oxidoreductase [Candidatus Saccharibacteria bacterium]|nr:NAD(P)/FAD-dependent oxidoreductase [Candidatus Saccharibacteria bacterium]